MKKVLFILVAMFLMSCGGEEGRKIKLIPDEITADQDYVESVEEDSETPDQVFDDEFVDEEIVDEEYDDKYFDPEYEPDCGGEPEIFPFPLSIRYCEEMKTYTNVDSRILIDDPNLFECIQNIQCAKNIDINLSEYTGNIDLIHIKQVENLTITLESSSVEFLKHPERVLGITDIKADDTSVIQNVDIDYIGNSIDWNFRSQSKIIVDHMLYIDMINIFNLESDISFPDITTLGEYIFIGNVKDVDIGKLESINNKYDFESGHIAVNNFNNINLSSLKEIHILSLLGSTSEEIDLYKLNSITTLEIKDNIDLEYVKINPNNFNAKEVIVTNNPKLDAHYIFNKTCMTANCTMEGNLGD